MKGHIKSLRVQNIQSHKDSTLVLHKGVNAIVGITDSGKSSLYRSLDWAINNRAVGKTFYSSWGGDNIVDIKFDDDVTVSRLKSKEGNAYEIAAPKRKTSEFKAFKTTIPVEVVETINMDDINLQTQLDAPFLLSSSAGDVAKVLNKVANLTSIDTAVSNIRKKSLSISSDIKTTKEQIEELEAQEQSFDYLEQMEKDVSTWQSLCEKKQSVSKQIAELELLITDIEEDERDIEELRNLLSSEQQVNDAILLTDKQSELKEEQRKLSALIYKIESQVEKIASFDSLFNIEETVNKGIALIEEQDEVSRDIQALSQLIRNIEVQTVRLASDDVKLKQLESEFKRSFPKICPLCER